MKKSIIKILCLSIISMSVLGLGGCGEDTESSSQPTTQAPATTVEATTASLEVTDDFDVATLHYYDEESKDPFAGAWKITGGSGSSLESFTYIFDGHGNAKLLVGNMGYLGTYTKDFDGTQETFTCQLMYGISGTYTFEFDPSGNSAVLTDTSNNTETIIGKRENYSYLPEKPEELKIDDNLVGAWKTEEGMYYYFGKDGIMYNNSFGAMFTCFAYSAENGKVEATYTMGEEITETYEYSFDGDTLVFDDLTYTKIPVTKLI